VEADARARLKDIDDELGVPLAVDHLLRRGGNRGGALLAHGAELAVGLGCRALHHADCADERGVRAHAADGEVLDCPRGLRAIHRGGGNFDRA
jgi:hypothetical protein